MTWGKVTRMYGLAQTLRRRAGQDPLNSFNDKDVTVLLCVSVSNWRRLSRCPRLSTAANHSCTWVT